MYHRVTSLEGTCTAYMRYVKGCLHCKAITSKIVSSEAHAKNFSIS